MNEEDLKTLQDLKKLIVSFLNEKYDYCGVNETKDKKAVYINSGKNINVRIEV